MESAAATVSQISADRHTKSFLRDNIPPESLHEMEEMDTANSSNKKARPHSTIQDKPTGVPPRPTSQHADTDNKDTIKSPNSQSDNYVAQALVVDLQSSDNDPSIGESIVSSSVSLRSSLMEYVEENGRAYHKYKEGDLQHHLFKLTFDGNLSLAPIKNPQLVLDIGTGTGIWAMEFATLHPSAKVIGTDLSAIQPSFVPPNCQFGVDDVEDEWTFNEKFDYIHGRAMCTCFQDTLSVFKRAYNALAPGGYFEMQEPYFNPHSDDGTSHGSTLETWNAMLIGAAAKTGRDWWCVPKYKKWFVEAGFEDVIERIYYWPSNSWPKGKKNKTLGLWMMDNTLNAVNAMSMAMMTRVLGMTPEEVEVMCVNVREDMKDKSIHAYYPMHVVYGRKPLST